MQRSRVQPGWAVILLALCAPVWAQTLPPQTIEALWVGKTLHGTLASGRGFTMVMQANGVITIAGGAQDSGTWRWSDAGYCVTWKTIRAGTERCFTVRQPSPGEAQVVNPDGTVSGTVTRVE